METNYEEVKKAKDFQDLVQYYFSDADTTEQFIQYSKPRLEKRIKDALGDTTGDLKEDALFYRRSYAETTLRKKFIARTLDIVYHCTEKCIDASILSDRMHHSERRCMTNCSTAMLQTAFTIREMFGLSDVDNVRKTFLEAERAKSEEMMDGDLAFGFPGYDYEEKTNFLQKIIDRLPRFSGEDSD
eukprot:TRINITY_DN406_c0_g1_i1.p1 TRINITY_DN406_c0_g1~~TRINITY_DN406_c0_g1_i1.p1  ORF type:complete len:186 (-),score=49.64 TRINITY_DN406_c0_g1_i1:47-604(-)